MAQTVKSFPAMLETWVWSLVKVKSESEVAQSCLTLSDPMDCSLQGPSVHGIFQVRMLEWVAIPFSGRSSWPRDWTRVSCIVGRRFTVWATRESLLVLLCLNYSKSDSRIFLCSFNRTVMTLPFRFLELDAPKFILYISCLRTEITHFSKELWFI